MGFEGSEIYTEFSIKVGQANRDSERALHSWHFFYHHQISVDYCRRRVAPILAQDCQETAEEIFAELSLNNPNTNQKPKIETLTNYERFAYFCVVVIHQFTGTGAQGGGKREIYYCGLERDRESTTTCFLLLRHRTKASGMIRRSQLKVCTNDK